jgi:hypothetical protein
LEKRRRGFGICEMCHGIVGTYVFGVSFFVLVLGQCTGFCDAHRYW